jgi:quercetin dioxygenase-like cupin family protein
MTAIRERIVDPSGIEPVRWHVEQGRILLRAEHTGGVFSVMEFTTPPGGGPKPHLHEREAETFYVLEGTYEILVGDRTVRAEPGALVYSPGGSAHGFRNIGAAPARLLCTFTPGGVESMFEEMADLLTGGGPVDPARISELIGSHGLRPPRPAV